MTVIPSGIYTDPEIAAVGVKEDELKEKDIPYKANKALTGANGRCLIENAESGFVKLLLNEEGILLGASIVAPHATELITELSLAVEKKMTAEEAIDLYYSRDASEKLFRGDKSYLGNKSLTKMTTKMKTKLMTQLKTTGTIIINLNHWFIYFQSNL